MRTHRLMHFENSCLGDCNQGRNCRCAAPDETDLRRAEAVRDAGDAAIRRDDSRLHRFLLGVAIVTGFLLALGIVGRWDFEDAQLEQQIAHEVAR